MSKLSIDQKNIMSLFQDKKSDFLIPDYQRPYAWTETECLTLWDDLFEFAIPDNNADKFNKDDEYYLGPIVTFKNEDNKLEIIDGQQRLTTLMLLLRAFHVKFLHAQDENSVKTRESIEKCIWKTDEFGKPNMNELKIDSEVATDEDKEDFLQILKTGIVEKNQKSKYAINFRFFQHKIEEFVGMFPMYSAIFPIRILNNCILLPIEADNQNTALRIFSTLNDRGMPLSDADIFKAQFYKYFSNRGQKKEFIERWKELEEICSKIFPSTTGSSMDELFTRYMYYERAKMGIKSSTTEALRKFYEKDSYALLRKDETLDNLEKLAQFWNNVYSQNKEYFSSEVLRKLYILNSAPNSMWTYFLSVYFMQNKDFEGKLEETKLIKFLDKSIAFIWTYAIVNPGVNALRTPIYSEMINIINNQEITFKEFLFDENNVIKSIDNFNFWNQRPITRSMLTWWTFNNSEQKILNIKDTYEIEHIFAKNRQLQEKSLSNPSNLELLGNKSLLEERINIRASDYRFVDKKKYYLGYTNARNQWKEGTAIVELRKLAEKDDFTENDIIDRNKQTINAFIVYLKDNDLIK